jgi:sulfite exporter TauE/SafE
MLSSIHPLGERARNGRWGITVSAFTLASLAAGALVGGGLGVVGAALPGDMSATTRITGTAIVFVVAGVLDMVEVRTPGPTRQVNEHWIGYYRGWVYGAAFGAQLGAGVLTYVVSWGVFATLAAELLTGSVTAGALVGMFFGFGRSITLLLAGRIDRPSKLASFHRRMAALGPHLRRLSALAIACLGVVAILGVTA